MTKYAKQEEIPQDRAEALENALSQERARQRGQQQGIVAGKIYNARADAVRATGVIERLRNGGQPDLADQVDAEIRTAYAKGREAEREHLERIGVVADCPSCGGRGERMASMGEGPHIYQDLVDCPDCKGTGYARVRPA